MALLDRKNRFRLLDIQHMHIAKSSVYVAPRPYHSLSFRITGTTVFSQRAIKTAGPGSITYVPAGIPYGADYVDANEIYVIHFEGDPQPDIELFELLSSQSTGYLFKSACQIWQQAGLSHYYHAMSVFYKILESLSPQTQSLTQSTAYKSFYDTVKYMKENYTDCSLTVERLSAMAYMSTTYFRKLFFSQFGETPARHLTRLRVEHAVNLLSGGGLTISQVALLSGFSDAKYFCRVIKKLYGYPPSKLFIHKGQP